MKQQRRRFLVAGLALAAGPLAAASDKPLVEVWKSPTCGCCKDWIAHMEANGFQVKVFDTGNTAMRGRLGVAEKYGACHTARVGGYVVEGHVPAADVRRLLAERPRALGLAVPGMPIGSPGMDGPAYKGQRDPYDVLLLQAGGGHRVFQSHN